MLCSLMHLGFCIEIYIPAKVIVIEKHFVILHYNQRDPARVVAVGSRKGNRIACCF